MSNIMDFLRPSTSKIPDEAFEAVERDILEEHRKFLVGLEDGLTSRERVSQEREAGIKETVQYVWEYLSKSTKPLHKKQKLEDKPF